MIPAEFEYYRPETIAEALVLLERHKDDVKILAGGHSLLPAMKLRLARPAVVVDLGRVHNLSHIREEGSHIAIGAMTNYYSILSSKLLLEHCPLLPKISAVVGDVQVRNRGTIGGSLAHADPAADWPAGALALDAELVIAGKGGQRTVPATEFFVDMLQTVIQPDEILVEIRVPKTGKRVSYVKTHQKASGFAVCGVAVVVGDDGVRVAINGVSVKSYRATHVESALAGNPLNAETIAAASAHAGDDVDALSDIHASAEYRLHLARLNTAKALTQATGL